MSQETRPHFGCSHLRMAMLTRDNPHRAWKVEQRQTLVSPCPSWELGNNSGCGEVLSGDKQSPSCRSCCVAGPNRDQEAAREVDQRPFDGLCTMNLPQWRSRDVLFANTVIGCRQAIIGILLTGSGQASTAPRLTSSFAVE